MSAIEVRGLTKCFGPVTAVDDLSFEVEHDDSVADPDDLAELVARDRTS